MTSPINPPSSENSVRRLAERIATIIGVPKAEFARCVAEIESLLSEAMDQADKKNCCHCDCHDLIVVGDGCFTCMDQRAQARSAAYRDAAEIAEETGKNGMPYYGDIHIQIADKLRRKSEGL